MRTLLHSCCIGIFTCIGTFALAESPNLYRVQLAAVGSATDATAVKNKLENAGWSPVCTSQDSLLIKIQFGQFAAYPDALWYKYALVRRGFPDAFIVSAPNNEGLDPLPAKGPLVPIFTVVPPLALENTISTAALSAVKASLGEMQTACDVLLSAKPESISTNSTDTKIIIERLTPIANANSSRSKNEVVAARLAIANAIYYGQRRLLTAYHAYDETLTLAEIGSEQEAECLLQKAAVQFELARASKGTLADVIATLDSVISNVSHDNLRVQSISMLMKGEAQFENEEYEPALATLLAISKQWPERDREVVAAQVYAGICYAKQNKFKEAKATLAAIAEGNYEPEAFFCWKDMIQDPALDALDWLIQIAANEKDDRSLAKWTSRREALTIQHGTKLYSR